MQIIRVLPVDHKGFSFDAQKTKKKTKSKEDWSSSACEAAQRKNKIVLSDSTILQIRYMHEFQDMKAKEIHEYFPYVPVDRIHSILQYQTRAHLVPTQKS